MSTIKPRMPFLEGPHLIQYALRCGLDPDRFARDSTRRWWRRRSRRTSSRASAAGTAQAEAELVQSLSDPRKDAWERFVGGYLSAQHRGDPAGGCTLGALAADAARKGPAVQARFAEAV